MVQHKDIQDPACFEQSDYSRFEAKLFSADTTVIELEDICMTLAHLPTKEAQLLLSRFQESARASEVSWLQCAIDEGQFHYLSPVNKTERRDLIALKLYYKNEERIIELMGKQSTHEFKLEEMQIELDAVKKLAEAGAPQKDKYDLEIQISVLHDLMLWEESRLSETIADMELTEKINHKIKDSITTCKYEDLDFLEVDEIKFDGEEW